MGVLSPPVQPSSKTSGKYRSSGKRLESPTQIWCRAICYNESIYEAPHVYDPERFLKDGRLDNSVKDPEERVFGSGRRYVCTLIKRCSDGRQVLTLPHGFRR